MNKKEVEEYLKRQVESSKEINISNKINSENKSNLIDEVEYMNTLSHLDYIFPIHIFLDTKDPVIEMNTNYPCSFRYLNTRRNEFLHLLNHKYQKYLTDEDREILRKIENKHFIYTFTSYLGALTFLLVKPFKNLRILKYYISAYLFFPAYLYSIYFVRNEIIDLKNKVIFHKQFNIEKNDLLDYTLIPDWRTYFYYYNYL